jgi:hypothetical protein
MQGATFLPDPVNPLNINTNDSSNNFHLFDQSLFTGVSFRLVNGISLSAIQFVSVELFINIGLAVLSCIEPSSTLDELPN